MVRSRGRDAFQKFIPLLLRGSSMIVIRRLLYCALIALGVAGCIADVSTSGNEIPPANFLGEADFTANPSLHSTFDDVVVSWLERAGQPRRAGDTGTAGEDRLPIVVSRDETRIFAMKDADGEANSMQLLNGAGIVVAETAVGRSLVMVRLYAGSYTLVLHRADGTTLADSDVIAVVMPLRRVAANPAGGAQAASNVSYTSDNPQITDAVAPINMTVLGDAPAMAMGNLYQAKAQVLSNAAHDATTAQQLAFAAAQAAASTEVATLYSMDAVSTGIATAKIIDADLIRYAMEGIRNYLNNGPDAADTAEGIRMWWINWDDYPGVDSLAVTLSALARLEQAGEIEGGNIGNRIIYRRKQTGA